MGRVVELARTGNGNRGGAAGRRARPLDLRAPDPTPLALPGLTDPSSLGDVGSVLFRNSLVLALHATACVAGFIAGSSLPLTAERHTGFKRWIHERARPVALAWVVLVTCFSLCTQAYILGSTGSTLATQLHISRPELVLSVFPMPSRSSSRCSCRWPRGRSPAGATSGRTSWPPPLRRSVWRCRFWWLLRPGRSTSGRTS